MVSYLRFRSNFPLFPFHFDGVRDPVLRFFFLFLFFVRRELWQTHNDNRLRLSLLCEINGCYSGIFFVFRVLLKKE